MIWREIRQSKEYLDYLPLIWRTEKTMPKWYIASSFMWTPTYNKFKSWASKHAEIFGLFDDANDLCMVIYIEKQTDLRVAQIHMAAIKKMDSQVFIEQCSRLRDQLFHRGVKSIRGWTLKRNFALVRLMAAIGFSGTGFRMDQGSSHGRVLKWELREAKAA